MIRNRQNIFLGFSRFLCLLIFAPFFAVQCFYYYNAQAKTAAQSVAKLSSKPFRNTSLSIELEKRTEKKATVNLNKRFQPGSILSVGFVEFEKPFTHCECALISHYINPFTLSALHRTGTLRGPPAC